MADYVVSLKGVMKRYPNGTVALREINLDIEKGAFCIIAGPNGAGKTTLLRIIDGELKATKGSVNVLSMDISKKRLDVVKNIGVMPQEAQLFEDLTVWEHVYYFALLKGMQRNDARRETARVLDALGLTEKKDNLVRDLSGGLKKRVNLAQALAGDNNLILLDEPTAGLDPYARLSTMNLITNLHENGKTVIFTTHYLDEVASHATQVVILDRGEIVALGSVDEILSKIGYDAKVRLPKTDSLVSRVSAFRNTILENRIIIWIRKNEMRSLIEMLKSEEIQNMEILRPTLEEAYLSLVREIDSCA